MYFRKREGRREGEKGEREREERERGERGRDKERGRKKTDLLDLKSCMHRLLGDQLPTPAV